jgi:hypothetical protein
VCQPGPSRRLVWLGYQFLTARTVRATDRPSRLGVLRRSVLAPGLIAVVASGCGQSAGRAATAAGRPATPQEVAIGYSQALFDDHISVARTYVAPQFQSTISVIAKTLGQTHVSVRNLATGSVKLDGESAIVILTGTFCNAHKCVTNNSASNPNPIFHVAETRIGGRWMVTFTIPAGVSAPGPVSGPPSATPSTAPAKP